MEQPLTPETYPKNKNHQINCEYMPPFCSTL